MMSRFGARPGSAHLAPPGAGSGRLVLMLLTYRVICLGLAVLVAGAIVRRRSFGEQVTAGMVLIPLLLRLFLVK